MKAKAVVEVVVVFGLTLLLMVLVGVSPLGAWERQLSKYFFIEYAVMIAFPLLILLATRRNLASYGLSLRNPRYHLSVAAIAIVPVAIGDVVLSFVNHQQWGGALIMSGVQIAVLFAVGWLLRNKPTFNESGTMLGAYLLMAALGLTQQVVSSNPIAGFVYYLFFLGLGEELLFRGYIQSRLNVAWGRPFQFFGVNWGWGIVITSVLFGSMHVLNTGSAIMGDWQIEWWWGLWTFFAGLVLGFVREKTGSIAAPTIIHGLPQALGAALGLF
jgi:hypothetical protein